MLFYVSGVSATDHDISFDSKNFSNCELLMNQMTQQRADEILRGASERNVVVYGDVMLDEFVWGDVTRISPEAPVPVVDIRRESVHLGGAANVLANLMALGARASVVGVVGDDRAGAQLRAELKEAGAFSDPGVTSDLLVLDTTNLTATEAAQKIKSALPSSKSS